MIKINKNIIRCIKNPLYIVFVVNYIFANYGLKFLSDKLYTKIIYKYRMGYKLSLDYPKTFNEKIQWLKIYDYNPQYMQMTDKYLVKKFITEKIGKKYVVPLLGVWDRFDDIDFNKLPNKFVLKCTHDSGTVLICNNKDKFDFNSARKKINNALKLNYYIYTREKCYKNIKPRIIAENHLGDNINDYKLFVFNGEVKAVQVDFDRFNRHRRNIYTTEWEYIPLEILYPTDCNYLVEKPAKLNEMIDIANKLAKEIPFIRVDLYYVNNDIYFGELTFYHGSGYEHFYPKNYDINWGEYIVLSNDIVEKNRKG